MAPASSLAAAVASTTIALAKRQDEAPAAPLVDSGANAWVMASAALVLLMLPGLGYFYSGLSHHKNALVFLHLCMLSLAIVSIQWFLWGFSLSFSPNSTNGFIGDIHFMGFRNVDATPYPGTVISTDVFAMFQGLFCALTAALPFGSAADRTRVLPSLFFIVIWATFVYSEYLSTSPVIEARRTCNLTHFLSSRPHCLLGLGTKRLAPHPRFPRLCRRCRRRNRVRFRWSRLCPLHGSPQNSHHRRKASQRRLRDSRHCHALVRLVGFQRWVRDQCRCQGRYGADYDPFVWCHGGVNLDVVRVHP